MKLNSESWYYRAKNRRNFTVYDDQEEINLLELANIEPSSEKVSIIFGSLYVNTNSKVLHIYCGTSRHVSQLWLVMVQKFKSRIGETKHLLTDADSSTDAIGGWTKNTPKPDFFEKRKKSFKTQKLKND